MFLQALVREAYREKALRAQREREAEERRLAEEKRKEEELRNRREIAQRERFDTLVEQWQVAQRRRRFLVALRESIGEVAEGSPLADWLQWAGRYIEMSDPLTRFRRREATIVLYYSANGHEIADIRSRGFVDAVPHVGYGEKPKVPGVGLTDTPDASGWGREASELVLPEDAVLPYETTMPGFAPRTFCVPATVLNASCLRAAL